jgi:hypothetical protein
MKVITVYLESDVDATRIMKALQSTPFESSLEAYSIADELSDADLETFDTMLEEYHEAEITEENYLRFKEAVNTQLGISYLEKHI